MTLIEATGWSLHYITHEIGLPALVILLTEEEKGKPKAKGLLASPSLNKKALEEMGLKVM